MSKVRSIRRKMMITPPEVLNKLMKQGEPLLRVHRLPDGRLIAPGVPLSEDDGLLVAYFVAEHYAIENSMTVEEFVFKMMRRYNEGNKRTKAGTE